MTTITTELRSKIERRAKRAWRRKRDGATKSISRVSGVTDTELFYRLPYTPDYYGSEKVKVVRHDDGTIEVDPKTKGLITCAGKDDLKKLKKHGDKVRAYIRTDMKGEVGRVGLTGKAKLNEGKDYDSKSAVQFCSKIQCKEAAYPGDRVFVAEFEADDIVTHGSDYVTVKKFSIIEEFDPVKDLGFTDGLLDCRAVGDLEKLKKHIGKAKLYLRRTKEKRTLKLNQPFTLKGEDRLTYREKAIKDARPGHRVWEVEVSYGEIKSHQHDGVKATGCVLIEELDENKVLGFTRGGMVDLLKKEDYAKLRKHIGMVRAYKYTDKDAKSPVQSANKIFYEEGKDYEVKDADTSDAECGAGINVASAEWCQGYTKDGSDNRIFAFEFHTDDIASIPPSDTKLRVSKCKCVDEVDAKTLNPLNPKPKPTPPPAPPADEGDTDDPPKGFFGKLFGG